APAPAPAPRQESAASAAPDTARPTAIPSSASAGTDRTVRPGETLSGIAGEVASGDAASSRAWMLAIYQANPSAFEGNMNVMRSGAVLRIPDNSTAAAISPSEAGAEIRRQWSAWRGGATGASTAGTAAEPGRLRLVPPADTASGTSTAAGAAENSQLQSRVRELESQLQESKRLLDARNAELAQLQARLAQQQSGAATPPPAAEPPPAQTPAAAEPPAAA